ncbi:hypothetical protein F2Q70_00017551 [Brassica cretica]|uniref:Aspartic peptidase DDI1-type domain-containing protein n=1 Tax=Brassica cretica TaxID=69181 RepID=A0A8S9KZW7_BRACR|nr:hypothetical protein F2Q70_00017551 [Brassica cretica]KAF2599297.1 hypothetical protein F2Q68_00010495 [Brassica cretica]
MPKIDVARLNALRPQPKSSDNPPEDTSPHSHDAAEPMEVDSVPMGRTLRKRKGKVAKHLKREATKKETESFQKRVFRIPLEKPFEEAYFTPRLWMFFRETRETEEDIRRMFYEVREKMKKSDPGKFAVPRTVKGIKFPHALCDTGASVSILPRVMADHLGLKVERSKESFTFVDCSQRSSGGIIRDLESILVNIRSSVQHANQPAMPDAHRSTCPLQPHSCQEATSVLQNNIYTSHHATVELSMRQNIRSPEDWENDYYNPNMAVHTENTMHTEEYDEDYEEERAIEYRAILYEEDRLLHHSSWKRNAPSIGRTASTSNDTHPHQTNRQRALTDIAYYPSIDTGVDRAREGDYPIGSWANDHHHKSYAVETAIHEPGADELHEGFTYEELLNMQKADQHQAETYWERTHFSHPCWRVNRPSINDQHPSSIDIRPKPPSTGPKWLSKSNR